MFAALLLRPEARVWGRQPFIHLESYYKESTSLKTTPPMWSPLVRKRVRPLEVSKEKEREKEGVILPTPGLLMGSQPGLVT
jgi:hypothetical protein